MPAKLKAAFGHSLTILWARVVALTGVALAALEALAADPSINDAVKTLLDPAYVPWFVIAIGVLTELARWRTAGSAQSDQGN